MSKVKEALEANLKVSQELAKSMLALAEEVIELSARVEKLEKRKNI